MFDAKRKLHGNAGFFPDLQESSDNSFLAAPIPYLRCVSICCVFLATVSSMNDKIQGFRIFR